MNLKDLKKSSSYFESDAELKEIPLDITKEYGLMSYYDGFSNKKIVSCLNMLSSAIELGQLAYLDLGSMQTDMNQHFKYFLLKKRYDKLLFDSQYELNYSYEGWHLGDATFETLDEVERALAQKAFL